MKLNVMAFAVTCALFWALWLFLTTWWLIAFEGATGETTLVGRIYRGYTVSPTGSFIGLFWGLADGFIAGLIFAWLYNLLASATKKEE